MDERDKVIEVIDNELLRLYNASKSGGVYREYTDFGLLLRQLNDMLNKHGCNDYYQNKVADYISVFNDLIYTEMKTTYSKIIEKDADRKTITVETVISDRAERKTETFIDTKEVSEDYWSLCQMDIVEVPEKTYSCLSSVHKYQYLLDKCKVEKITGIQGWDTVGGVFFQNSLPNIFSPAYIGRNRGTTFEPYIDSLIRLNKALAEPQRGTTGTGQPQRLTIPDNILQALQQAGFIENAAARPLKWIAYNKRAKGETLNKKSLLDLLCLLGYPDNIIKDRKLLNSRFIFPNNQKLTAQNYTYITDTTKEKKLKRPIISEYHTELESIINQTGKEK